MAGFHDHSRNPSGKTTDNKHGKQADARMAHNALCFTHLFLPFVLKPESFPEIGSVSDSHSNGPSSAVGLFWGTSRRESASLCREYFLGGVMELAMSHRRKSTYRHLCVPKTLSVLMT